MDQQVKAVKPFLEYDQLIKKLSERGMLLNNPLRAQRKLTQIGYYRLSGYWSPALKFRRLESGSYEKLNEFKENTSFESIFQLYLFDKNLRLELTCAIERIEIYLRTIIAHELGRLDPRAHHQKQHFSKNFLSIQPGEKESAFDTWHSKHEDLLRNSREESILSHIKDDKPIPIWVASEAWTLGTISKLYSMLNGANQDLICNRLGIDNRRVLDNWLINITGIRNRCAHHSRVCNRPNIRALILPRIGHFNLLQLGQFELNKIYGLICVIWFLVSKIGQTSNWINRVADLIDSKPDVPGLTFKSMGFSGEGFPRKLFPQTLPSQKALPTASTQYQDLLASIENFSNNNQPIPELDITDQHIEKIMALAIKLEQLKKHKQQNL